MKRIIIILLAILLVACIDLGIDYPDDPDFEPPQMTRALEWIRANPMFVSGLSVSMGEPPSDFVNTYFNDFYATAVHLWEDGLPREADAWAAAGHPSFRFVSWVKSDGTSADGGELIGGYSADVQGRIGFQIGDEPARDCLSLACAINNLQTMEAGVNAVRALDSNALIYLNFQMSDYVDDVLDYYGEHVDGDIISYDHYTRSSSAYEALEIFRHAGLDQNKPYWRYLKSYYNQDDPDAFTESDMRWNAFSGILYGYTGHTWFFYNIGPDHGLDPALFEAEDSFNTSPTALWHIAAQINIEMYNLGRAITQLTSTAVRYIPLIEWLQPKETKNWEAGAGNDPYIVDIERSNENSLLEFSVGFFRDDTGEFYFMLQNVSHTHGSWPVSEGGTDTIRITFDFSNAPQETSRSSLLTLNKLNGKVETLLLTQSDGNRGYLDVTLAAGDPILLKYVTGAPFAIR
ncbi:MAG: hypothetical protein QF466_03160 [Desulfobacterales bacterium]|jgi:hypothetical protein|nr:hypothetical protein [Desulfobacterales bacterium]MDP6684055.1 hypothetical protein [Desulfobacterales bacterium]MDP6806264.1 hypothetical protein [Desulfobacterales bacterium]|tara:strand:+ start:67342 stop:68721 length:1380 start_codon:yes stop_codon:yes gene_type:complete